MNEIKNIIDGVKVIKKKWNLKLNLILLLK